MGYALNERKHGANAPSWFKLVTAKSLSSMWKVIVSERGSIRHQHRLRAPLASPQTPNKCVPNGSGAELALQRALEVV